MPTTSVIQLDPFDLGPQQSIYLHHDPDPSVPFDSFVQLMVRPVPSGAAGEGDQGVVRAAKFKGQLVLDPTTLQPTIRWHWDVFNESDIPVRFDSQLLVVTP